MKTLRLLLAFALALPAFICTGRAESFESITSFGNGPRNPERAHLYFHSDGSIYGTSANGGANGIGTVFKMDRAGNVAVIVEFAGVSGAARGAYPNAGLINDSLGFLWGTTAESGAFGRGTIFKINAATGAISTVADFTGPSGAFPGGRSYSGFVNDGAGYLWGTTSEANANGFGTIFKVNPTTDSVTTVHHFSGSVGPTKGWAVYAPMITDGAGFLWGTTRFGGTANLGTVFKVEIASGAFTTVAEFTVPNASRPQAGLVADGHGNFWGGTIPDAQNRGTLFKVEAATGVLSTALEFTGTVGPTKGTHVYSALVNDGSGFLWGTTSTGGSPDLGTIFKINPLTGEFTNVVEFTGTSGAAPGHNPIAPLCYDGQGYLWGTTSYGGTGNVGTVYRIKLPPLTLTLTGSPPETPVQRPAYIALEGMFTGGDGSVTEVSFYDNGVFLGTAPVSAPGLAVYYPQDIAAGTHRYTARVSDADETATSNEVEYVVTLAPPPVLSLVAVEDPMPGSALLEGTVLPSPYPATVTVEWGLTTAYGSTVVVNYPFYSIEQPVDILLTGLRADTTYHFRVTAANVDASVTQPDSTFTTAPSPPPVVQVLAQAGVVAGNLIGTELSDAPGYTLSKLGVPAITNRAIIAVSGAARHGGTGKTLAGVLLGSRAPGDSEHKFRMPLRVGDPVPESAGLGAGLLWKAFPREPFMDYTDDPVVAPPAALEGDTQTHEVGHWMGFYGRVSGLGVTTANDDVLGFYALPEVDDEVLVVFAREGGDAPGVPGAKYKSFTSAAVATYSDRVGPDVHGLAFTAMLQTGPSGTPGPGGVTRADDMGLFIFDDTGGSESVALVLREGQALGARTVRSFIALRGPVGHGHGFTSNVDVYGGNSGSPVMMVLVTFSDGFKALVAVSREGIRPLATTKTTEPWAGTGPALPWATFPSWFQNGDGRLGVLASLTPGTAGVTSASKLRILAEDANGDLRQRVATGDVNGDGSAFTAFKSPVMNRDGALAFAATVKLGTATLQRGYHQTANGLLLPYIEQNAVAPGANGGVWRSTLATALPDGMGPLFVAKLRAGSATVPAPGGVTAATDLGLWAVDSFGTTHLLVREGGALAGKTVRTFKALTSVAGSPAQSRSFNGRRDVIVWVLATDFTQHLVHFAVP
jgi:uncharacterized repeat protein (TIGR03803 family)